MSDTTSPATANATGNATRSGSPDGDGEMRAPEWLRSAVRALEDGAALDPYGERLAGLAAPLLRGRARALLQGHWLGHALHPLMTDFPLGCWIAAGLLDLAGGRAARPAAQRLVGVGLLAVPATAAAGVADWSDIDDQGARRVGVVHAAGNSVVAGCYLLSWRQRRRGHHARGVLWGLAGGGLAWATGYLGGHLSFGRGVGVGERGLDAPASADDAMIDLTVPDTEHAVL